MHCTTSREDGEAEDSTAGPSQRMYLAELSAEASAEHSRRLATLTKNKTKRSVHCRSQESNCKFNMRGDFPLILTKGLGMKAWVPAVQQLFVSVYM